MEWVRGRALNDYKQRLVLRPEQHHLIIGSMLGDGCLRFPGRSHHANLTIEHGARQEEYVWYKFELLKDWVLTPPRLVSRAYHKDRTRILNAWRFSTLFHELFTPYYQHFYQDGTRVVPDCIGDLLKHPLSLAVWLMDDGNKNKDVLFLNTESFTLQEQERLRGCLWDQFHIDSTLNSHSYSNGVKLLRIRLSRQGSKQAVRLIAPYVLPSLSYKFSAIPL